MGISKKNLKKYSGVRKYNKIIRILVKDKKKRGEKYVFKDIQKYASSIYPNFKETPYKSLKIGSVLSAKAVELLSTQRNAPKLKETPPFYPLSLISPDDRYYFDVATMIKDIEAKTSNEIFFISEVLGSEGLIFQGGTQLQVDFYNKNFQNLVTFLDKKRSEKKIDYTDIRILCTPPKRNLKTKIWESKIILTDSDGNIGETIEPSIKAVLDEFDPNEKYAFTKIEFVKPAKVTGKPSPAAEQISLQESKERIDVEKQKTLQMALEMVKNKQMTWDQYDKLLSRLYPE
jgi:hypothetical protein